MSLRQANAKPYGLTERRKMTNPYGTLQFVPKGYRVVPVKLISHYCNAIDNLNDTPISDEWADEWQRTARELLKEAPRLTTPPVLRWEGNLLYVGNEVIGRIHKFKNEWSSDPSNSARLSATKQEARRAAEKALGLPIVEEV